MGSKRQSGARYQLKQRAGNPAQRQPNQEYEGDCCNLIHIYRPFTMIADCQITDAARFMPHGWHAQVSFGNGIMSSATAARPASPASEISGSLMTKVFYVFAALAVLSVAISISGKWFGQSISKGGHTDSAALREIVIGNNVIVAPENMIRFPEARRDGVTSRLDLYMRWPDLERVQRAGPQRFQPRWRLEEHPLPHL